MAAVEELKTSRSVSYLCVKNFYEHFIGSCRPAAASHNRYDQHKKDPSLDNQCRGTHQSFEKRAEMREMQHETEVTVQAKGVESLNRE